MADDPSCYNSGTARTLDAAREAARTRVRTVGRAVGIYEHVGGRHPGKGQVAALGTFLWRDLEDGEGRPLGTPRFYWREVEQVQP